MEFSLASLDNLPGHRRLLANAMERFAPDARFIGLLLGGSLAAGGADLYSDIDLYAFVRDNDFESTCAERERPSAPANRHRYTWH